MITATNVSLENLKTIFGREVFWKGKSPALWLVNQFGILDGGAAIYVTNGEKSRAKAFLPVNIDSLMYAIFKGHVKNVVVFYIAKAG